MGTVPPMVRPFRLAIVRPQGALGEGRSDGEAKGAPERRKKCNRITSYNVCYTKLLRARIGALLNHPNIVHVYDVDERDGIPYIAMEYIRGEELNMLCRRGLQLGRFLPLEHAVYLLRQAAQGMGS